MVNLRSSVQKSNLQLVSTFYQSKRFEKHKLSPFVNDPEENPALVGDLLIQGGAPVRER